MKNNILLLFYFILFIYLLLLLLFFTSPRIAKHTTMHFMLQTVRSLENAGFKTNNSRRQWCSMVLPDTHRDARASISPSRPVQGSRHRHGFIECLVGINFGSA